MAQMYDKKGNASHYKQHIDYFKQAEVLYGTRALLAYLEINAGKYSARLGLKEGVDFNEDGMKRKWYLQKAEYFRRKIKSGKEVKPSINLIDKNI